MEKRPTDLNGQTQKNEGDVEKGIQMVRESMEPFNVVDLGDNETTCTFI